MHVAGAAPRARPRTRSRILLLIDERRTVGEIVATVRTSPRTVARTRREFVEGGVDAATADRPRPGATRVLDERGRATWRLLAGENERRRWRPPAAETEYRGSGSSPRPSSPLRALLRYAPASGDGRSSVLAWPVGGRSAPSSLLS